jgi:hypothetical protein
MKNLIVAAALAVAAFCLPQSSFGQASPFDLVVITNVPATLASTCRVRLVMTERISAWRPSP